MLKHVLSLSKLQMFFRICQAPAYVQKIFISPPVCPQNVAKRSLQTVECFYHELIVQKLKYNHLEVEIVPACYPAQLSVHWAPNFPHIQGLMQLSSPPGMYLSISIKFILLR